MTAPGDDTLPDGDSAIASGPLPLVLGLIGDLFFSVRVEDVARRLGYQVRLIERADQVAPADEPGTEVQARRPGEPLTGQAAALIAMLAEAQPALIVVDLNNRAVPWEDWIATIKSSAATRRTPVIAFGSHMDVATQTRGREVGADAVLAKSRFVQDLPDLIRKYARVPDRAAISEACEGELSPLALRGLRLFNAGDYFEAHEELEHAWNQETGPARELYRAILQVAVAYLQITRQNYAGALKMFLRAHQWIDPLPEVCRGVQVGKLRRQALRVRQTLEELGEGRIGEFDLSLLLPVEWE
jgi:predicted metal-dependent hydrolase